jgi:UDP-N-acetyl-2-amino-2-deoxyglucuronate dehydrogenase
MERQIGFGFVGAGEIAVESAEALADAPNARLVAVCDVREHLARDIADRFDAVACSRDELLADPAVDAVYVCVPHHLHREIAFAAVAARKHVFVEKPMGVTPEDARAIVRACADAGVACGVPFPAREAPAYRAAREIVSAGRIGRVTGFAITFRADKPPSYWTGGWSGRVADDWRTTWAKAGGGTLLMNTIHDLDALLSITGLDVERVRGVVATTAGPGEVEDLGLAILSCSDGAVGGIEAVASLPGGEEPSSRWVNRVYGSAGQIVLPTPWGRDGLALFTRESGSWSEVAAEPTPEARTVVFEGFAAALIDGRPPPVPGEDGLRASRIVHAIYEAAREDRVVELD